MAGELTNFLLRLGHINDKAKPAERRGRKATGPRFLREATEDFPKEPKTAELPRSVGLMAYVKYGLIAQKEERYVNESYRAEKTGAK